MDCVSSSPKALPQEFEIRLGGGSGGISFLQGIFLGHTLFEWWQGPLKVRKDGD